jgi:PST family polysaccharide transporter
MNQLVKNMISLSSLNFVSYLIPLITLPFLVSSLGIEHFGAYMFAQSLCVYFIILTDFGFSLSANRLVSINRGNRYKLDFIYSETIYAKIILLIISFLIFSIILNFSSLIDDTQNDYRLFYFSFLLVVGNAFSPAWVYQGLEKVNFLVISTVVNKTIVMFCLFYFIQSSDNLHHVPLIFGIGSLILAAILNFHLAHKFKIKLVKVGLFEIFSCLKLSSQYFASRVANEGLMNSVNFLVGLKFGEEALGYYSVADKLYRAFYSILGPINQALYPFMAKTKDIYRYLKVSSIAISLGFFGSVLCIIISPYLYNIFFPGVPSDSLEVFRILCLATFFGVPNALVGFPLLGALGHIKYANYSLLYGSFIASCFLILAWFLYLPFKYFAVTMIVYEFISLAIRLFYVANLKVLRYEK